MWRTASSCPGAVLCLELAAIEKLHAQQRLKRKRATEAQPEEKDAQQRRKRQRGTEAQPEEKQEQKSAKNKKTAKEQRMVSV